MIASVGIPISTVIGLRSATRIGSSACRSCRSLTSLLTVIFPGTASSISAVGTSSSGIATRASTDWPVFAAPPLLFRQIHQDGSSRKAAPAVSPACARLRPLEEDAQVCGCVAMQAAFVMVRKAVGRWAVAVRDSGALSERAEAFPAIRGDSELPIDLSSPTHQDVT